MSQRIQCVLAGLVLLSGMTGCSQIRGRESPLLSAVVSRFPACAAEIKAFFALNKYIAQSGADRDLYDPALQALQDQMTDCVDDNYDRGGDIQPVRRPLGRDFRLPPGA
jgi:hypothetical protein